jgi:hypothetical protein
MNSVACDGYAGVSNAFAESLWVLDTAFEAKAAGTVGFDIQSGGSNTAQDTYSIGSMDNSGNLTVYSSFYGLLFLAEAIQNSAKPLPVTITQSSGNVKVWATIDASNVVRVIVLEKDTDGPSNSRTVTLNLGPSYTSAGTLTTMTASSVSETSDITIGGQTFNGTTNGLLTGPPSTTSVTPAAGIYTLTLPDGSAALLTIR